MLPKQKPIAQSEEPRDRMWKAVISHGRAGTSFTIRNIASLTRTEREAVRSFVNALVKADLLEELPDRVNVGKGNNAARQFKVKPNWPAKRPLLRPDGSKSVHGLRNAQMWRAMKMNKAFTVKDLQLLASTPEVKVALATARNYIKALTKAGYLQHVSRGAYRLLPHMNTGPKPPSVTRVWEVVDHNLNQAVWTGDLR